MPWATESVAKEEFDPVRRVFPGEEYAAAKRAWTKLSAETDRLYEKILQHPPKAEDTSAKFDVKSFNQDLDGFRDEVSDLFK